MRFRSGKSQPLSQPYGKNEVLKIIMAIDQKKGQKRIARKKSKHKAVLSEDEYSDRIKEINIHETLENMHPSCTRKLIEFLSIFNLSGEILAQRNHDVIFTSDTNLCK